MLIMAIATLSLFSCTKNNTNIPTEHSKTSPSVNAMRDGEDDDLPIINHKIVDIKGDSKAGAIVVINDGHDTLTGTTNRFGVCHTHPTHLGSWDLKVILPGYLPLNQTIVLVDSITCRVDTLLVP